MPVIGERPEITLDDIVLATDFSVAAKRATKYAIEIARRYGSRLHIVNVVNLNAPIAAADVSYVLPLKELTDNAQALLSELSRSLEGLPCTTQVAEGFSVSDAILNAARECDASLIVMGTTSKAMWEKMLLGSTAEEVIRTAKIPVLTVGPHVSDLQECAVPFQRIVFANDWSDRARKTLPIAFAFAEDGRAHLYLCRVAPALAKGEPPTDDAALLHSMETSIPPGATDWCKTECVIEHGKASQSILDLAERTNADLIILAARSSTFRLVYLEKGVTPAVIAAAKCPVLSYCPA